MNYRIVERADTTGEIKFFPQYKKFIFWINFIKVDMFPEVIKYDSYQSAEKFIKRQIEQPEPRYYYIMK